MSKPPIDQSHLVPTTMSAVLLTGHGGFDRLEYRTDIATPTPGAGEVLIRVSAAGVNNTDVNTRIGWYSKAVSGETNAGGASGFGDVGDDGAWSDRPIGFPRIQGADCCGRVVAVADDADGSPVDKRVLVRSMQVDHEHEGDPFRIWTFGSEVDGAFAQYAVAKRSETYAIDSDWSDVELASIPCAYSTAEGLMHRADVGAERVLITGASGGVGSAAVQLARRRGAEVIAVAGSAKADAVLDLGADRVVARGDNLVDALGSNSVDVVIDLVAGPEFATLLDVLRPGGRYAVSGAIAGPLVELDVRTLYLKDLTLLGSTAQPPEVFENLVGYIERGEIRPVVAATYPLAEIVAAQERFLAKDFVGKIVLTI